jgi:hypothetical protein
MARPLEVRRRRLAADGPELDLYGPPPLKPSSFGSRPPPLSNRIDAAGSASSSCLRGRNRTASRRPSLRTPDPRARAAALRSPQSQPALASRRRRREDGRGRIGAGWRGVGDDRGRHAAAGANGASDRTPTEEIRVRSLSYLRTCH